MRVIKSVKLDFKDEIERMDELTEALRVPSHEEIIKDCKRAIISELQNNLREAFAMGRKYGRSEGNNNG